MIDIIEGLWQGIQLNSALESMVSGIGSQVGSLLPAGIGIMCALAVPRVVKRIVGTFL